MPMRAQELKPCPFCGGQAEMKGPLGRDGFTYEIVCSICAARIHRRFTREDAGNYWNMRVIADIAADEDRWVRLRDLFAQYPMEATLNLVAMVFPEFAQESGRDGKAQ